jgi:hypothetical protein
MLPFDMLLLEFVFTNGVGVEVGIEFMTAVFVFVLRKFPLVLFPVASPHPVAAIAPVSAVAVSIPESLLIDSPDQNGN